MKRTINILGNTVEYDLQIKNVKNVNIRIKSDLTVKVSAPFEATQKQIEEILQRKAYFIISAIEKYRCRKETLCVSEEQLNESKYASVFGKQIPIEILQGKKNRVEIADDHILVELKDIDDGETLKRMVDKALDELCHKVVVEICREVYPKFEKYLPCFPTIKFRHMKSRWGSCNFKKHILTFNYHLVRAPLDCVEYVVYHEFTHFIHPNHSKAFYSEFSRYVPDYKEKKKLLGTVVIN